MPLPTSLMILGDIQVSQSESAAIRTIAARRNKAVPSRVFFPTRRHSKPLDGVEQQLLQLVNKV